MMTPGNVSTYETGKGDCMPLNSLRNASVLFDVLLDALVQQHKKALQALTDNTMLYSC